MNLMRALGDPVRRRLFETLHRAPDSALTVDDATTMFGLDRTVAFDHLETLRSLGLITAAEVRTGRRGRPADAVDPCRKPSS